MIEFNESTKQVVAFLREMQNLGFSLHYEVSVDKNLSFEIIEVDFYSSVVQSLLYCLLVELARYNSKLSFSNCENLFIYCENDAKI